MKLSSDDIGLALGLWGAALSTFLAIKAWIGSRTRIGMKISRHFRMSNEKGTWEWIMLDVALTNLSEKTISILEYGLNIALPDKTNIASTTMHFGEMPNGDSVLENPDTQERVAVDAQLQFLENPQNIPSRSSVQGWIAFRPQQELTRDEADSFPMQIVFVDQNRKKHCFNFSGLGPSVPWKSDRFQILEARR